jgi:uncharacterized SAM-binding protein YcdF (DUF218 family)
MFFVLAKTLGVVEQPLNWAVTLVVIGTVLVWRRRFGLGRWTLLTAVAIFTVTGIVAIPTLLLRTLEDRYPVASVDPAACRGMIVLGGSFEAGRTAAERGQVLLNGAAERLTTALQLARAYPSLQVVFTGFSSALRPEGVSEADLARQFFADQGLDSGRVRYENRSRDTYENARYMRELPGVDATRPWLLITSAAHMPRAMAVFRKAGWNVNAWPVDYATGRSINYLEFSVASGANRWQQLLHELLGLVAYRATGRI